MPGTGVEFAGRVVLTEQRGHGGYGTDTRRIARRLSGTRWATGRIRAAKAGRSPLPHPRRAVKTTAKATVLGRLAVSAGGLSLAAVGASAVAARSGARHLGGSSQRRAAMRAEWQHARARAERLREREQAHVPLGQGTEGRRPTPETR